MSRSRGFSLAETMLAVGILAIAILALMAVFIAGMKMSAQSVRVTLATEIGREFMEAVKTRGHGLITPGTYDGRIPTPADATTGFPPSPYPTPPPVSGREFVLWVEAQPVSPEIMSVEVRVHPREGGVPTRFKTWVHQ